MNVSCEFSIIWQLASWIVFIIWCSWSVIPYIFDLLFLECSCVIKGDWELLSKDLKVCVCALSIFDKHLGISWCFINVHVWTTQKICLQCNSSSIGANLLKKITLACLPIFNLCWILAQISLSLVVTMHIFRKYFVWCKAF